MPKQQESRFALQQQLAEGDQLIMDSLNLDQNEKEMLEHIVKQMETDVVWTEQQQSHICVLILLKKVCDETVVKPKEVKNIFAV